MPRWGGGGLVPWQGAGQEKSDADVGGGVRKREGSPADVVRALARHVEACPLQGGDHAGPVLHLPGLDALHQVVPDRLTRVGLVRDPRPQLRRLNVGAVPRLLVTRPRRVIRAAPALVKVAGLDERPIGLLPARRRDVEALARLQVAPRGEHMHVHAAGGRAVLHRRPGVAIRGPAQA